MYFKQNIFIIFIILYSKKISPFIIIFHYMCFSLYHPFQYQITFSIPNKFIRIIVRIFSIPSHSKQSLHIYLNKHAFTRNSSLH